MMTLISYVGNIDDVVSWQFSLDIKVPVVAGEIAEGGVEDHRFRPGFVGNRRRGRLWLGIGHNRRKIADYIKGELDVILLERWVAACVTEQVAEDAIMEDSECASNRSFSVPEWIPRQPEPWLPIRVVLFIKCVSGSGAYHREVHRLAGLE